MTALPLQFNLKTVHLSDEQFYQLCITNSNLNIERSAQGILLVMPPVGGESRNRELQLGGELYLWNKENKSVNLTRSCVSLGIR